MKRHVWVYPGSPACDAKDACKAMNPDCIRAEFFRIANNGGLTRINESPATLDATCNGFSVANVALFKQLAPEVLVTVAGASRSALQKTFNNSASITTQLVNFVVKFGLDGIDIDFEGIGSWAKTDFDAYLKFLTMLGTKLDAKNKKLSVCCPIWHTDPNTTSAPFPWSYESLAKCPIDYFSIMSYDYQYDMGGGEAVAPLAWLDDWMSYLVRVIPKDKLVMGLPAYGYSATMYQWNDIRIRTKAQAIASNKLIGAVRDAGSAELKNISGTTVWFINDKVSLQAKANVGAKYGISAFSIWHAGGGNDYI